jgi:hypothetical protein
VSVGTGITHAGGEGEFDFIADGGGGGGGFKDDGLVEADRDEVSRGEGGGREKRSEDCGGTHVCFDYWMIGRVQLMIFSLLESSFFVWYRLTIERECSFIRALPYLGG